MVEPFTSLVSVRQLQTFFPPQALDLLMIDVPTFDTKKPGDLAITVSAILLGQPDQSQAQFVIILWRCLIAQTAPRQADRFARSPFRRIKPLTNMDHGLTQIGSRQTLGFK